MPAKAEPGGVSGVSRGGDAAAQRPAEPEGAITLEQRAAEWGEYLRKHDIERLVEAALAQVIADRPARPLEALATLVEAGIPPATRPAPPKGERAEALAFLREHALEQALQRALLPLLSEYVDLQLTDRTAADGEQVGALLSLHPPSSSPSPSPLSNTLPPLSPTLRLSRAICRVSCEGAVGGAPLPSVSRTDASARAAILVKADPRSARAPRPEPRDAFARDSAGAPPAPFRSCADASAPVWAATALSYERG